MCLSHACALLHPGREGWRDGEKADRIEESKGAASAVEARLRRARPFARQRLLRAEPRRLCPRGSADRRRIAGRGRPRARPVRSTAAAAADGAPGRHGERRRRDQRRHPARLGRQSAGARLRHPRRRAGRPAALARLPRPGRLLRGALGERGRPARRCPGRAQPGPPPAYPNSVCGVVYQGPQRAGGGCQFTFTCDGSLAAAPGGPGWARARRIAAAALAGDGLCAGRPRHPLSYPAGRPGLGLPARQGGGDRRPQLLSARRRLGRARRLPPGLCGPRAVAVDPDGDPPALLHPPRRPGAADARERLWHTAFARRRGRRPRRRRRSTTACPSRR